MKKYISLLLALTMVMALFAGCATTKPAETTAPETTAPETTVPETTVPQTSSVEILETLWASYMSNVGEDMLFPAAGGDENNTTMDNAGKIDVKNAQYLTGIMNVPADLQAQIDDAANLMHMMNANTFTAGAYHLVDGSDIGAFTKTLTDGIKGTQWICGFPDQLVVATLYGEYVIAFYGNIDLINLFKAQLTTAYADAVIVAEESMA